jgi:AraC family transcriptional regulator, melibiose operon regulatory protein
MLYKNSKYLSSSQGEFLMTEAYFESGRLTIGDIQYPFSCHYQESRGKEIMANAHWHYYIEMLYSLSGRARVILGGVNYIFNKGDMVLINAREVHSVFSDYDEGASYIVVKFDPEVLYTTTRTVFESKYVLPFTMAKTSHQKVFTEEEIKDTYIPLLVKEMLQEYQNKNYGFELAIRTHICRIFLWVLRNWQNKGLNLDASYTLKENEIKMLQKVFDYLDENYQYDITAESVAKMCNMSYSYFSRHFKAIIGKTFTEYLNYIRITEAEKFLLTTDMNITEVALKTGFSDSSYFIKQFRHFKNVSPKQFQKKIVGA